MATIKGVWTFKDLTPFTAPAETIMQAINFTTADGTARTSIEIKDGVDSYPVLLNLDGWTVAIYNGEMEFRWLEEYPEYKTVDFGQTEQTVSDEFYSCFVQVAEQQSMTLAEKLVLIAENEQRVYDAGYAAGQAAGGGGGVIEGLPKYETDMTFAGTTASVSITHNLGTQKFLLIGRVKEHDGTDLNTYRCSQIVVWSPNAFFQDAEYMLANGGTYNPYKYWVEGNRSTGAYVRLTNNGGATATAPQCAESARTGSTAVPINDGNKITVNPNGYLLAGATWHFTVIDVSSIM